MTTSTTRTISTTRAPQRPERPRLLLRAGAFAGPLFVLASIAQMPFRDGFDVTKHPFSFLLIGSPGWIQSMVFVAVGGLFAAAGAGLLSIVGGRLGTVAFGSAVGVGAGKIVAGLAAPQPSFGFPPGTPDGPPAVLTTASVVHAVAFGVAVLCWISLLVMLGVVLRRRAETGTAWLVFIVAALLPAIPATSGASFATVLLYAVAISAYLVTSVALLRIARRGRGRRAGTRVA
ncbi:MAG TPA: DUF998 domain-containing protein [Intrasporangium sp.]|nr:DUF998 domain-containing protein [Intrasporangium sp.]